MSQFNKALPVLAMLIFLSFPIAMGLTNILMLLFLIAWIFSGKHREYWLAIQSNPVPLLALLLYGVILTSIVYSTAPTKDITLHLNKYSKLLFVALIFSALLDKNWQQRCMQAFTGIMLFILISTWLNIWFILPWSATKHLGWGLDHHVVGDYITQNVMMSFFVLLCLTYAHAGKTPLKRIGWSGVALLAAISITHLSQGRTGYLLLITALMIFVLCSLKGKALWTMLFAIIFGLGVALLSSQTLTQRFNEAITEAKQSDVDNQSSIGHRLYNYKKSLELIAEKPILGWGTGAYHTQMCRVVEKPEWCEIFNWHPHNQFLYFGVDHGLLGMLAYIALISAIVWLALRDKDPHARTLLLGFAGLLVVDSLFNSPLWSARENHFFAFMMALLAARSGAVLRPKASDLRRNEV